ncbi:metal ABC transporter substrate-binding protein [Chitinivibrio alkaliphilus]|uniref:ABC transporter periplasmic metal binding protein component n=1 Tax=Chitinivibrio alkaliphilus ACht1 TaxID=1313304 RepID=U7D7P7_9BACT|nr:metal ABC transporter substrate-binding protein [Chitinivibrio alkaliphilus]ERP31958.1 ABC transporter periplasmic metal binding protein component [Chitinivibrio alkaliphilus ACht1]
MNLKKTATLVCISALSVLATVRVTTTTTDLKCLVEKIGGDKVEVTSLVRPLQDAHYLDATPGMVMRISRSDLFVENGFELEMGWVPEVLRETRNRDVRRGGKGHVNASRGIQAIQVPDSPSRDQGDVHPSGNPHYTLEPVVTQQAARNIADGLIRVDEANAAFYLANLDAYIEESNALVEKWQEKFSELEGTGVIKFHSHFDYMLKKLGLRIVDAIEPLPGLAPSAGHVARLISRYDENSVGVVIMEPWHDERVARQVAEGIGVELLVLDPAVGASEDTPCILALFEHNAHRVYRALGGE